jgi:hypothetical protein
MESAFIYKQAPSEAVSLDIIYINPGVDISLLEDDEQQIIARFVDSIGPMQPVIILDNGYLFLLGMNWVYVSQPNVVHISIDLGAA